MTVMRIYLTIDTECREERLRGGRLLPAAGYDMRVWGRFSNQEQELGIPLIMDEFEACGLRGSFYVDPFGADYFGRDALRRVCETIMQRGHDIQLHAHPVQQQADWITRKVDPPPDDMAAYDLDQQQQLLTRGKQVLIDCGVPGDNLVSFRAGNFGANNDTWRAMAKCGLSISSNYNPCYRTRNSKLEWPELEVELFDTGEGVWELPISNFVEPGGGYRHLQITAVSLAEMKDLLCKAEKMGVRELTIVTHSFEFMYLESVENRTGRLNRVNFSRLRGLCRFLADNAHRFKVETVAELSGHLPEMRDDNLHVLPHGSRFRRYGRWVQQAYKRLDMKM
ncbi:polysaccharide deacetylase family protein [Thiolapillus brandeum]|uniref:Polysaccharide deacetylase n=1 Tax=Thiolapillus brandeum TaxID=1076588 RepID=A0A7U6JKQ1_9GAMM|nr:hypothetical protein [Thiolapillus brandeum]BAO45445.1 conserved hypothetical protein [Thiolapillus brandeum]